MREWLVFDRPSDQFPWLAAGRCFDMPVCLLCMQACNYAQIHLFLNNFPGPPCSSLCWDSGSCFPTTKTGNILLISLYCNISQQTEHLLMGWVQVPLVIWCVHRTFMSDCVVFQMKVGQPASNLENSEVTLWPFTRYALLQLWLELGISF